jgi:hypothetical protein
VVSPAAHEGEHGAVRRPTQRAGVAADLEQLLSLRRVPQRDGPHLSPLEKRYNVAARRDGRRVPDGELAWLAARQRRHPNGALGTIRGAQRVGDLPLPVGRSAPHVHDRAAVGHERQIRKGLAIVRVMRRELSAPVVRCLGDPDVPHPLGILDPGNSAPAGAGHRLLREGRAEDLLQREGLLCRRGRRQHERDPDDRRQPQSVTTQHVCSSPPTTRPESPERRGQRLP